MSGLLHVLKQYDGQTSQGCGLHITLSVNNPVRQSGSQALEIDLSILPLQAGVFTGHPSVGQKYLRSARSYNRNEPVVAPGQATCALTSPPSPSLSSQ